MKLFSSLVIIWTLYVYMVAGKVIENAVPETDIDNIINKNNSDPNKDMYVIHAMVYQVGIITNKTEDALNHTGLMGNQEAVTFYHTTGSDLDLSSIPNPLLTNVTAQRVMGVAPLEPRAPVPWSQLDQLSSHHADSVTGEPEYLYQNVDRMHKRSLKPEYEEKKEEDTSPVKIESGTAVIPGDAGVQSIVIPPLLTLNTSFSEIPVPIPNTSVVHYAKINTLVKNVP